MTLRELRNAIVEFLQTEPAVRIHSIKPEDVIHGRQDGDIDSILPNSLRVNAFPVEPKRGEDNGQIRTADVIVWCIVESEPDAYVSELNAYELAEKIEALLINNKTLRFKKSAVEIDGTYPNYSVAMATFQHNYTSSAL